MHRPIPNETARRRGAGFANVVSSIAAALLLGVSVLGCAQESTLEEERLRNCLTWREGEPCVGDEVCFGDGPCRSSSVACVDGVAVFEWSGHCATCAEVELLTLEEVEQSTLPCEPGLTCTHPDPEGEGERRLQCVYPARFELAP